VGDSAPSRRRERSRGFTLIEVVVSLSILALVAGGLSAAFRMTARSMERGEEAVHDSVLQRARFAVLDRAFRAANPAPVPTDNGAAPFFRGEADRVTFLSVSPLAASGNPGGEFRLLTFSGGRTKAGERGLLLSERSPFSKEAAGDGESAGGARVVFPGASGVSFFYVSGFDEAGSMSTETEWDAEGRKRLPVAVGIEFEVEGEAARRRIVVPLPVGMNQLPDVRPPHDAGPVG
jgi:prepilin-type N-terminal cleavage/methylation domain-containing protein